MPGTGWRLRPPGRCIAQWLMPWLRHAAPSRAEPRVVVVSDGGELIGIAPFVVQVGSLGRADYRLFGVPFTERREPLARDGAGRMSRPRWRASSPEPTRDRASSRSRGSTSTAPGPTSWRGSTRDR